MFVVKADLVRNRLEWNEKMIFLSVGTQLGSGYLQWASNCKGIPGYVYIPRTTKHSGCKVPLVDSEPYYSSS